jgi:glycosyltransferase involved in cell wall biosynthesis
MGHLPAVWPYPIGVVIPTYNRPEALLTCLQHLEKQTWRNFEVVVVNDGSTDRTPQFLEEYQLTTPLNFRYLNQKNSGPACARNRAICILQSEVCVLIGDDIFPSPDFVLKHFELHQQRPEINVAGLGLTRWSDSGQTVTPFMRWLEEDGVQFANNDLLSGIPPTWRHFYTSNLSVKTQLLRENPFNELFTRAAAEDMELGYRLEQFHSLQIAFIRDALAHHLHPTSFRQACKRNITVGSSFRLFHKLWPETAAEDLPRSSSIKRMLRNGISKSPILLGALTMIAETLTAIRCPNPLMRNVLSCYFNLGYQDGNLRVKKSTNA